MSKFLAYVIVQTVLAGFLILEHAPNPKDFWIRVVALFATSWLIGLGLLSPGKKKDSEDEWQDLEDAFKRIRSDLKQESEALSREREELDVIMGSISDAILAVDSQSRVLFVNPRFESLFGKVSEQALLGEVFRNPDFLGSFQEALKNSKVAERDLRLPVLPDSILRDFSLSVTPLRAAGRAGNGAVGVFHDVSELKRAERLRIDFVANVSHELRTPLTSIKGYTDTAIADLKLGSTTHLSKFLEVIRQNADRLMALINDILDLSSLDSSEADAPLQKIAIQTEEITHEVVLQLEPKWRAKRQEVSVEIDAAVVKADRGRLEQVLVNLIDNAIKYTPESGEICVKWTIEPSGSVALRVIDDGPGLSEEDQARVFERFYRVDKARSRELGGTGLGLAIVKHIMQRHGGSISVRSRIGQGAEFVCEFPSSAS